MAEKHREARSNLKQRVNEYSNYTTFHGLHFVIGGGRGIYRRIIWLLLILTGLGFLANQLYISYNKLTAHEHVITREIISTKKLVFPAVTICNVNMMKKFEIKGTDAQVYMDQQNSFKKIISPRLYLNMSLKSASFDAEKAVLRYGHTARDMIHVCTWDGELCSYLNVTTRFSQIYGLCHTFNSGHQGHPLLYSTSVKRSRGLHLFIFVNIAQYYGINSYFNTGIRMVIHDQDEEPMVETNGIDVAPGYMTTMNIQRTEYHSLPPPFKSACGSRNLKTSKVYSRSTCLLECNTRKVIQKCGCRLLGMPELPEFNGTQLCNPNEIASCLLTNLTAVKLTRIEVILAKYFITYDSSYSSDNPQEECDCPKPCKKVQYKISQLNTVAFLSESFWEDYLSALAARSPHIPIDQLKANLDISKENFRKDFLFLIIHYDNLETLKTSEKKAYDVTDFGSDVGGYLGLFLGCSVLTVFEIFDFIICHLLGKRKVGLEVDHAGDTDGKT